jgi:mRNA interferase MazF
VVTPLTGSVVLVPFPFSDLSQSKLRPGIVLVTADRGDWVLCQITRRPYGDSGALELRDTDFATGVLESQSFARPAKLFTAYQTLFVSINKRLIRLSRQLREFFSRMNDTYSCVESFFVIL